jgi:transcription initiation factor TFIIIB Brf1 subunit/transcription initiation factor TFIIB
MRCPRCGRELEGREERYATVYVCEPCGIIVLDLKLKLDVRPREADVGDGGLDYGG